MLDTITNTRTIRFIVRIPPAAGAGALCYPSGRNCFIGVGKGCRMQATKTSVLTILVSFFAGGAVGRAGHNSLLAVAPDGRTLLVANPDNGTVSVVDTLNRTTLHEVLVGDKPESVAWIGGGPLAIAACHYDDRVVVFNALTREVVASITTAAEPYGVVVDRAARFAYVTNEYPGVVSEIDLDRRAVVRKFSVGPFVRGIAMSPDERRLFVTHYYTGWVSAVDRRTGEVVDQWRSMSPADNLARQIAVHPVLPYAYVPHIRSRTQRAHGSGSIFPYLSVLDLVPETAGVLRRHTVAMDSYNGVIVTCNPWETTISPDGRRNYTIYAGTNDMNVSEVLDDHYRYIRPITGLVRLGNNPRAVAVSPDSATVYVYNALDGTVWVFQADPFRKVGEINVCDVALAPDVRLGKIQFNTANPPMTSQRWIACSSCHPDGDHDGRTWQNPEGLRRTLHFFGMKHTHPIHWSADRDEVHDFEHTIRGPLMQGRGLIRGPINEPLGAPNAGRSKELDALAAYCNHFEHRLSPNALGPGRLSPAAERGRQLFFSKETRCAECHRGPHYTDSSLAVPFIRHNVGTGSADPSEKMGPAFDTPTLLRVYRYTEYLHHGKAKSLEEVLTTFNPDDKHGKTSHLSTDQVSDLVAFLKSLPYELPDKR
jgi:YVTN family beta-propeller protein